MNAPERPGGPEPDDTFDHFFSKPAPDGDETRPIPQEQQPAAPLPAQPQPGYALASEPAERRKSPVLPILVIVASLIVVAVVAFLALGQRGGTPATAGATLPTATSTTAPPRSSSPAPSTAGSSTAQQPSTSTTSPSSTAPSPTSTTPSAAALPASVQDCHTSTFSVGPKTSCEFGASVAAAAGSADFSHGPVTLKGIYSPETKKTYTLHCDSGGYITCTSTTDAVVYVQRH